MSSQAQAEASRTNGARGRGPVTDEGKDRSSRNAVRHGLSAVKIVLLDQENSAEFRLYRDEFLEDLAPAGALEESLVERIVISNWRLRRAARLEANMMDADMVAALKDRAISRGGEKGFNADEPLTSWEVGRRFNRAFGESCCSYDALGRHKRRIERGMFQAIKELRGLQKDRGAMECRALDRRALECGAMECGGNAAALASAGAAVASTGETRVQGEEPEQPATVASPVPADPGSPLDQAAPPDQPAPLDQPAPVEPPSPAEQPTPAEQPSSKEQAAPAEQPTYVRSIFGFRIDPETMKYIEGMERSKLDWERELAVTVRKQMGLPPKA